MTSPFAPTIYHDGASLFLEWPTTPGAAGYAYRFPFTEGGLGKALRHIPNIAKTPGYVSGRSNLSPKAAKPRVAKRTKHLREKSSFTDAARNAASAAVRKLKVGE